MSQREDWLTYSKFTPEDLNNPAFQSFLDFSHSLKDRFGEEKPYKFIEPCLNKGNIALHPLYAEGSRVHPHRIQAYLYFREQRANHNNPLSLRKQYNAAMRTMEQSFNKLHCQKGLDIVQRLAKISMFGKHTGRNFGLLENMSGKCANTDYKCRTTPIKFVDLVDLYDNPLINYQKLLEKHDAKPMGTAAAAAGGRKNKYRKKTRKGKTRGRKTRKKRRKRKRKTRRKKLKRRTLKKIRKQRMKAGGNPKIEKGLQYAEKLVGIRYSGSSKAPTKDSCPFWNRDGPAPSIEDVKKGGLACVGITNLIRRHLGLKIPIESGKWKYIFPGGSGAWFHYLKEKKRLQKINYSKTYPKGTLLLEDWNPKNMGHVAIVWTENKKGLLHSKILHGRHDGPKSVVIEPLDDYKMKRRFTHVCLPEDWLVKN